MYVQPIFILDKNTLFSQYNPQTPIQLGALQRPVSLSPKNGKALCLKVYKAI